LVLPLLFALGWVTARYDRGQQRREVRHVPQDILQGLSATLSDDFQSATDHLLCAARSAPDSTELHRAVGNLYRKRGLIDRAIEVHESAIQHPEMRDQDRPGLMLDLGRDYLAAGLFDRAELVLQELVGDDSVSDANKNAARLLLMNIAQRTRDWSQAIGWAQAIYEHQGSFGAHDYAQLMGHFYCEVAVLAIKSNHAEDARIALSQAEKFASPGPWKRVALIREQMNYAQTNNVRAADTQHLTACKVCGFRSQQTYWQCPGCHHWDSFAAAKS
jgi:lipopolysaccharide biosynthesis regulator YciM